MTARFYLLEDVERIVKVDGALAWVFHHGAWHESASAWAKVTGFDGADGREITAEEAARLIRGERFSWTEEDVESGGVYFHRGDENPGGEK